MARTALLIGGAAAVLAVASVGWLALSGSKSESCDADPMSESSAPDVKDAPALMGTGRVAPKEAKPSVGAFKIRGHVLDAAGAMVPDIPVRARRTGPAWDGSSSFGVGERAEASFAKALETLDAPSAGLARADAEGKSAADGSFEIALIDAGQYEVAAAPPPPRVGTQVWTTASERNPSPELALTVRDGSALEGRVIDAQDKGVAGVVSASWSMSIINQMWSVPSVRSDPATGAFRFAAVPEGKASLGVTIAGRASIQGFLVTTPHEGVLTIRIGVGGGAIKGRVSNSESQPVPNADLTVWVTTSGGGKASDGPNSAQFRGKCGPDGAYRVEGVIPGKVSTVQALAPGYVLHSSSAPTAPWSGAEVAAGADAVIDVVLLRGGKVVGRIVESGTGAGVADADVLLFRMDRGPNTSWQPISAKSDAQGHYAFDVVAIGKWLVLPQSASHYLAALAALPSNPNGMYGPDGMTQGPPVALLFVLTHEGETVTRDVEMKRGLPVNGRVVGPDGAPVVGARVIQNANPGGYQAVWSWGIGWYGNGQTDLATSGADGIFSIPGLAPQVACVLLARKEGLVGLPCDAFKVAAGAPPPSVTLKMVVGGSISGHVFDADGRPLQGANVYAWNPSGIAWSGSNNVTSDAQGAFIFTSVPEGKVTLSAQSQGLVTAQKDMGTLTLGEKREGVELRLARGVSLSGIVVDEAGNPVAGRQLWVNPIGGGQGANAMSAADGTFEASGLPVGRVQVMVMDARGAYSSTGQQQTYEAPSRNVRVVTSARKTTVVSGRVTDPVGTPVPLCTVSVRPKSSGGAGSAPGAVAIPYGMPSSTNEVVNGEFRVEADGSPPLEVTVSAARDANAQPLNLKTKTTSVSDPASGPVVIVLESGLEIGGRVLAPDDAPVESVTVRAGGQSAQSDAKGAFRFGGLEAGDVLVAAGGTRDLLPPTPVKAKAGTMDVVLRLTAGLVIAGQVLGPDDRPFPQCSVSASWPAAGGDSRGQAQAQGQPGADGRFRLGPIPDVRGVTLYVNPWSGNGSADAPRTVRLTDVKPGTEDLVIRLQAGVGIEGRLVGPGGEGIASASVQAQSVPQAGRAATPGGWAQTDSEGAFVMGGLEPGTYNVTAWIGSGGMTLEPVKIDAPARGVRLVAVRTQSIEGRVEGAGDLSGFRVSARAASGTTITWGPQQQATTDASGRFKIDGVGTGTYRVTASKSKDDRYGILENVRGGATGVAVGLEAGGSIEGTLDDATGQPVSQNGTVGATNDTWQSWTSVDADGRFRLSGLPPGAYKVTGSKRGGGSPAVVESVQPGATNVRLRLPGS